MFKKKDLGLVFNVLFSFVLGLILTIYIQVAYAGGLTLEGFLTGLIKNFSVGFTLSSMIPLESIGNSFLKLCHCSGGFLGNLLSNVPVMVIMGTLMNFLLWFLFTGISSEFLPLFWRTLPAIILVAYLSGVVATPLVGWLTGKLAVRD